MATKKFKKKDVEKRNYGKERVLKINFNFISKLKLFFKEITGTVSKFKKLEF